MVLIDTCGWIEWLTAGQLSDEYEPYFLDISSIVVPTSVQFELYKWVAKRHGIQQALESIALTAQATVTPLSTNIALLSADYAIEHKLSFADAIIYASAQYHNVQIVTSDDHFEGLPKVTFFRKITLG